MEMSESPEIATSPLSKNILSAVENVKLAAQQGREKAVGKLKDAKIGMVGLTVGAAFFLAACGGEGTPSQTITAFSSITPVPEAQTPSEIITPAPTERELFQQDKDTLMSIVRTFFHEEYFKGTGYDLGEISDKMKGLTWGSPSGKSYSDDRYRFDTAYLRYDGWSYKPHDFTEDKPISASFKRDKKTGKITEQNVGFYIDKDGKLLTYRENFPYAPETKEDFDKLFDRLSTIVKIPEGSRPGVTLENLDWESSVSEGGFSRHTVIRGDEGDTVISLSGVAGNGLNLVSVSSFKHSNPTSKN